MHRVRRLSRLPLIGLCAALLLASSIASAAGPAPAFHTALPKLQRSLIPVYLPSWLPDYGRKVYPFVSFMNARHAYDVELSYVPGSVGTATLAMYMTAGVDDLSPGPHAQRVSIGHGITALVGSVPNTASDSLTIRWKRNGVVYVLGHVGNATMLIHMARSVVRVH